MTCMGKNHGSLTYKDSWKTDRILKGAIRKTEVHCASQQPSTSYVAGDRRSYEGIHLRCVDEAKVERMINAVHLGVCVRHMNGKDAC
jgi:hypothetical protein